MLYVVVCIFKYGDTLYNFILRERERERERDRAEKESRESRAEFSAIDYFLFLSSFSILLVLK